MLCKWLKEYRDSNKETKRFINSIALLTIIVLAISAYCFIRLAFPEPAADRSGSASINTTQFLQKDSP